MGAPDDAYEQEADRVAERVMRAPEPRLQRACGCGGQCSECQPQQASLPDERLQAKSAGTGEAARSAAPPVVEQVLASPGQPLDTEARAFFEPRFAHDFSRVRVHADGAAGQSARAVNALAYTVGRDIVFGSGQYAPRTHEGQRLLAHELTHVIQQSAGTTTVQRDVDGTEPQTNESAEPSGNAESEPYQAQDPPAKPPTQAPAAPGPKCAESINWTPQAEVPADVLADSAVEFVDKMNAALGGNPHMTPGTSFNLESDSSGKVTKVNFNLTTSIIRPRHAGGRMSAAEKALIGRIVEAIKTHEERHRDIAREVTQKAVCDALGNTLVGAKQIIDEAVCNKMPTAQEAHDGKEGKIELVKDGSGAVTDFKLVGVKVNYHDPKCK